MSGTHALLTVTLLGLAMPAAAQTTLAEAAAAAAKIKHEWPVSTSAGPTKVITNKDLKPEPTSATPAPEAAAPAESAATPPVITPPVSATPAPGAPTFGPTPAQLHELELTDARTTLKKAQVALREGEEAQRQLQHTYENGCSEHGGRIPTEMIRPCVDMEFALAHTGPAALDRLRAEIRKLAVLLGLDPTAAARSFAR